MAITKQLFDVGNGNKRAGIIFMPDLGVNEKAALLIQTHGTGQSGDGTLGTVDKLFEWRGPITIANETGKFEWVSPLTAQTVKFIVIALQGINGWTVYSPEVAYVVKDMLKTGKVDLNLVFVTGLSAGGETAWECVGGIDATLYAAAVPLSTPSISSVIVDWNRLTAKVQAIHGKQDSGPTDYNNSVKLVDQVNAVKKGYASLWSTNDSHNGWDVQFSEKTKRPYNINGVVLNLNMYEWMLACPKGGMFRFLVDTSGSITPTPTNMNATFTALVSGNTVTLDPAGSTGTLGSYDWFIGDLNGKYKQPESIIAGKITDNNVLPVTITLKLANGDYKIVLNMQSNAGAKTSFSKVISVGSLTQPIDPVPVKKAVHTFVIDGTAYTLYDDGTWK